MAELVPRQVFFAQADRHSVLLAPDGEHLAWVERHEGTWALMVAPWGELGERRVLIPPVAGAVQQILYASARRIICLVRDAEGPRSAWAVDLQGDDWLDLTPEPGADCALRDLAAGGGRLIIDAGFGASRTRYIVDLRSAEAVVLEEPEGAEGLFVDGELRVRAWTKRGPDGSVVLFSKSAHGPTRIGMLGPEDAPFSRWLGLDAAGEALWLADARDTETMGLIRWELANGRREWRWLDTDLDLSDAGWNPERSQIDLVSATGDHQRWVALSVETAAVLHALVGQVTGDIAQIQRSVGDTRWVVGTERGDAPMGWWAFDVATGTVAGLFTSHDALTTVPLRPMEPLLVASKHRELQAYLTRPATGSPNPMVLLVHGGPWSRDRYGYHPWHQWLASRGYAVLSVNYRGSVGFGRRFVDAADRRWSSVANEDLHGAIRWARAQGIAQRAAVVGLGFGGTLALLTAAAAGEDLSGAACITGPLDLVVVARFLREHGGPHGEMFAQRIGDPDRLASRRAAVASSPTSRVDQIRCPVFIAQGGRDVAAPVQTTEQFVAALRERERRVTYANWPDEGHGLGRQADQLALLALLERFLASTLGGPVEAPGELAETSRVRVSMR